MDAQEQAEASGHLQLLLHFFEERRVVGARGDQPQYRFSKTYLLQARGGKQIPQDHCQLFGVGMLFRRAESS
jgi:hypothetical protein